MDLTQNRRVEYSELAALFFLQAMATATWLVPLSRVLDAHGVAQIRPYAFATTAVAAFISPLIFGAMADRHASPVTVLRGLAVASATGLAVVAWSLQQAWPAGLVLALIQLYAICAAPTGSIANAIVFSRLQDSQRQFGPIRATATFGWMVGCWLISLLNADASVLAAYAGAVTWLVLAAFTFVLPAVAPPSSTGRLTLRQRLGWDALSLLQNHDHRVVFFTAALFSIPLAAFYPYTPPHLKQLGFERTSAWMSLGQVSEIFAMFALGTLFLRWRLKWIFGCGLVIGLLRYLFCALDSPGWLLAGVSLHGLSFTLFFITAQIYINERVDPAWRARAQALMWLMIGGVGNLLGYLGSGFWFNYCAAAPPTRWTMFWTGLAVAIAAVTAYFLAAYQGWGPGRRGTQSPNPLAPDSTAGASQGGPAAGRS